MNMRNEPVHVMACVVKRETPPHMEVETLWIFTWKKGVTNGTDHHLKTFFLNSMHASCKKFVRNAYSKHFSGYDCIRKTIQQIRLHSPYANGFAMEICPQSRGGVWGKPKIVAKRHPSVSNSAWESIFQMNVDCYFTTWKLGFCNISKYLARYGIQMDPSITIRRKQSEKKPDLFCGDCYPRLSKRGSELIQKMPMIERLPRRFNIVEHR